MYCEHFFRLVSLCISNTSDLHPFLSIIFLYNTEKYKRKNKTEWKNWYINWNSEIEKNGKRLSSLLNML